MILNVFIFLLATLLNIKRNVAEESISNEVQLIDEELSSLTKNQSPITVPSEHKNIKELIDLVNKITKNGDKEKKLPAEWNLKHWPGVSNREIVFILKQIVENKHQKSFIELLKKKPNSRTYYISNPQVLKEFKKSLKQTGSRHHRSDSRSGETYDEGLINLVDEMKRRYFNDEGNSPFRENELDDVINEKKLALRTGRIKPKFPEDNIPKYSTIKEGEIENEWGVTKKFSWANVHSSQEVENPIKFKKHKSQNLKKQSPEMKIKADGFENEGRANKLNIEEADVIERHKIKTYNKLENEDIAKKWNTRSEEFTERHKLKNYNKLKHENIAKKWNIEDVTERHKIQTYTKKDSAQKDSWDGNGNEELGFKNRYKTTRAYFSNDGYKNTRRTTKRNLNFEDEYYSNKKVSKKYDYDDDYHPLEKRPRGNHRKPRYRSLEDDEPARNSKNRDRGNNRKPRYKSLEDEQPARNSKNRHDGTKLYGRTPPPSKGKKGIYETQ